MDEIELMDVKATADYLRLSTSAVYKLIKNKKIKHIRIGRKVVFTKQMLNEFLLSNIVEKENYGRKELYI